MARVSAGVWAAWLVAAAALLVGCPSTKADEKACSGASALSYFGDYQGFQGGSLPAKTLSLTLDDGPGSQTVAVSAYLKSKGIRATFFVNGHCFGPNIGTQLQCQQNTAAVPADIFPQVIADGHLVQNHTQTHADLTSTTVFPLTAAGNAALVKELTDTDTIIAPYVAYDRFLFRAPFGAYNQRDYNVLQASPMSKYVGPVKWDVGGGMTGPKNGSDNAPGHYAADWDCWQNFSGYGVKTTAQCATRYLQEIAAVGHGIVLVHDGDYGNVTNHNLTSGKGNSIDMIKLLLEGNATLGITGLLSQGYKFVRVDEITEIAAALPKIPDAGPDASSDAASFDATIGPADDAGAPPPPDPPASSTSSGGVAPATVSPDPCAPSPSPFAAH